MGMFRQNAGGRSGEFPQIEGSRFSLRNNAAQRRKNSYEDDKNQREFYGAQKAV